MVLITAMAQVANPTTAIIILVINSSIVITPSTLCIYYNKKFYKKQRVRLSKIIEPNRRKTYIAVLD
jgi:hypothetical protein